MSYKMKGNTHLAHMDKTIDYPNDGNGKGGKVVTPWTKPLDIRAHIGWSVFFFLFLFSLFFGTS
jgi:hypothetical protein